MTSSLTLDTASLAPVTRLDVSSERAADAARTAVDKAFEILAALPAGGQFVGVSELARSMRLSKSTVFRLLTTMERNGFVEREDGRYRLGRRLHDIGAQVYEPRPGSLHELLSPIMAALYERSRETVHLGVLRDNDVVLLGRLHGRRTTPHPLRLGSRFPAHCSAMGKALLAHDPDATDALLTRGLIARTPRSIISPHQFRAELRRTRDTGIATADQEARPNLSCVAVALRDAARRPVAALSISGPTQGFDAHRNTALLRTVSAEAEQLLRRAQSVELHDTAS
jgi:IclR family transcriptional regulator, KDG regulon repressor